MAGATVTLMTAEEFAATYTDVPGYELVRGEVVELMAGGLGHSRVTGHAYSLLENWAERSGLGRTFTGETGLIVDRGPDTVRGADVAYFSYARLPVEQPLASVSFHQNIHVVSDRGASSSRRFSSGRPRFSVEEPHRIYVVCLMKRNTS